MDIVLLTTTLGFLGGKTTCVEISKLYRQFQSGMMVNTESFALFVYKIIFL